MMYEVGFGIEVSGVSPCCGFGKAVLDLVGLWSSDVRQLRQEF